MATTTGAGPATGRKLVKVSSARPAEVGEVIVGEDPASADLPHRRASKLPGSTTPDEPLEDVGRVSVDKSFSGEVIEAGGTYWIVD